MRHQLIAILRAIEAAIPPPGTCHHAFTYAQYGSDADGWRDELVLEIKTNGVPNRLFLEDDDFGKTPEALAAEVAALLTPQPAA